MQQSNSVPTLPPTGFVRLSAILSPLGPIPVSKSTWWSGIKSGRFPIPLKLGPRTTVWRVEEIQALIDNPEQWRRTVGCRAPRGVTVAKPNDNENSCG
jgi:prophage regulatory protein